MSAGGETPLFFEYTEKLHAFLLAVSNCQLDKETVQEQIAELGRPKYQPTQLLFADCILRRLLADTAVWSAQCQPSHEGDLPIRHLPEFMEAAAHLVKLSHGAAE